MRLMRTDFSYSNTLGWNTFPLPKPLTEKNKSRSQPLCRRIFFCT
ncbi:MAG: type IIL restriction-modification enzyme MmeI [Bdellovibrionota bacterium]